MSRYDGIVALVVIIALWIGAMALAMHVNAQPKQEDCVMMMHDGKKYRMTPVADKNGNVEMYILKESK